MKLKLTSGEILEVDCFWKCIDNTAHWRTVSGNNIRDIKCEELISADARGVIVEDMQEDSTPITQKMIRRDVLILLKDNLIEELLYLIRHIEFGWNELDELGGIPYQKGRIAMLEQLIKNIEINDYNE